MLLLQLAACDAPVSSDIVIVIIEVTDRNSVASLEELVHAAGVLIEACRESVLPQDLPLEQLATCRPSDIEACVYFVERFLGTDSEGLELVRLAGLSGIPEHDFGDRQVRVELVHQVQQVLEVGLFHIVVGINEGDLIPR